MKPELLEENGMWMIQDKEAGFNTNEIAKGVEHE